MGTVGPHRRQTRARTGLALAALALSAAGCGIGGSTRTVTVTKTVTRTHTVTTTHTVTQAAALAECKGSQVTGTFAVVPGSQGAGQISYELRLTNSSPVECYIRNLPEPVQLLDAGGTSLPTNALGTTLVEQVTVGPGDVAVAEARFSRSVPGSGDSQSGQCQPKATTLRLTLADNSTTDAPVRPPTSVCEHGTLHFGLFKVG